jgi:amino-acid N-acetyltransferase
MNQPQYRRAKARHYVRSHDYARSADTSGAATRSADTGRADTRTAHTGSAGTRSADAHSAKARTRARTPSDDSRSADLQVGRVANPRGVAPVANRGVTQLRTAVRNDARKIHELIERNRQAGHLLPRQLSELTSRIDRFVVAVDGRGSIVACGELAPLSSSVAEIRSLVVLEKRRGQGLGRRIVDELKTRAKASGYDDLCVFAHQPAYFAHMGFSIVPHTWVPEKIMADCRNCTLFRRCGQFAMVTDLDAMAEVQPAAQLHV